MGGELVEYQTFGGILKDVWAFLIRNNNWRWKTREENFYLGSEKIFPLWNTPIQGKSCNEVV